VSAQSHSLRCQSQGGGGLSDALRPTPSEGLRPPPRLRRTPCLEEGVQGNSQGVLQARPAHDEKATAHKGPGLYPSLRHARSLQCALSELPRPADGKDRRLSEESDPLRPGGLRALSERSSDCRQSGVDPGTGGHAETGQKNSPGIPAQSSFSPLPQVLNRREKRRRPEKCCKIFHVKCDTRHSPATAFERYSMRPMETYRQVVMAKLLKFFRVEMKCEQVCLKAPCNYMSVLAFCITCQPPFPLTSLCAVAKVRKGTGHVRRGERRYPSFAGPSL